MNVNWCEYARQYDLMADNNPAYQKILAYCLDTVEAWRCEPGSVITDFGAGTGNFSIALAKRMPQVFVLHLESSPEMIKIARGKAKQAGVRNWSVRDLDLNGADWDLPALSGAVTVHLCPARPEKRHTAYLLHFGAGRRFVCLRPWQNVGYLRLGKISIVSLRQKQRCDGDDEATWTRRHYPPPE